MEWGPGTWAPLRGGRSPGRRCGSGLRCAIQTRAGPPTRGIPLAAAVTAANVDDSRLLEPLLDAITPVRTGYRAAAVPSG